MPTFESLLLSSPRLCGSIRKLGFGRHYIMCAKHYDPTQRRGLYGLDAYERQPLASFTTLAQALPSFPRLRELDIRAKFDESGVQPSEPHLTLDKLQLYFSVKTSIGPVLAFLTSFRRIDTLSFQVRVSAHDGETSSVSTPLITFPTPTPYNALRVDSLEVSVSDHLEPLRRVIDFNSIRILELHFGPTAAMLQQMGNLHTLRIRRTLTSATFSSARCPPDALTPLGMISRSCYLGPCLHDRSLLYIVDKDWSSTMRNLHELANATTSSLFIEVIRASDSDREGLVSVERIGEALEALDWRRLEELIGVYPSLNHLELHFYHDIRSFTILRQATDLPQRAKQCVLRLERIARQRLSASVLGRIPVTVRVTIDESYKSPVTYTEAIIIT